MKQRRELRLRSVVFNTIWTPQEELVAACNHIWARLPLRRLWPAATRHETPSRRCTCGIHAARDLETAASYLHMYDDVRQPHLRCRAIGRVSLWGSVVEGEHGWRASHAYPERILLPKTDRRGKPTPVDAIADGLACYGVPVEVIERVPIAA